jgi:hypothetical protein
MDLIWSSGITLVGCVPEVTDMKDIFQWCKDKLISERRIIQMQGHQDIYLTPTFFKILHLPTTTMQFKSEEDD